MNQDKINKLIESLCSLGCTKVNSVIKTLESGADIDDTKNLSAAEITVLIDELKSIMDIYNNRS